MEHFGICGIILFVGCWIALTAYQIINGLVSTSNINLRISALKKTHKDS